MPNVKISDLPAATSLVGTERIPIVQDGRTVGASVGQFQAGMLASSHAGAGDDAHAPATSTSSGFMTPQQVTKLASIQASATANAADAALCDRSNHTGTQSADTIRGGSLTGVAGVSATGTVKGTSLSINSTSAWGPGTLNSDANWGMWLRAASGGSIAEFAFANIDGVARLKIVEGGGITPGGDNTQSLGLANARWGQVYAVTGTINTSDEREKERIEPVDVHLAERLLSAIRPVTFKWRDDVRPEVSETRIVRRARMETVEIAVDEITRTNEGRYVRMRRRNVVGRPVYQDHLVFETDGSPALDADGRQLVHRVSVEDEIEESVVVSPAYHKENVRTHWGFVAQKVEAALCQALGLDPMVPADIAAARLRFAGVIHDPGTDSYGLREGQLIPILWSVVQRLTSRVTALENPTP